MLNTLSVAFSGALLTLSLLIAIGPQNTFVLKRGLIGKHMFYICMTCFVSDSLLILIGVYGLDAITKVFPPAVLWAKYFGIVFLVIYGTKHLVSFFRPQVAIDLEGKMGKSSVKKLVLVALVLTWFNPYVLLDTVILIGSVSTQYGDQKDLFALGAILTGGVWFFALGYGARLLRPWFQKPLAWQILDGAIAIIMYAIAYKVFVSDIGVSG